MKKGKAVSTSTDIRLNLSADLADRIERWASEHDVAVGNDAIRRLLELGLTVKTRHAASARQRDRAATLAGQQIDQMSDVSASHEVRASRKQRLTEGPSVFRTVRRDRSKTTKAK